MKLVAGLALALALAVVALFLHAGPVPAAKRKSVVVELFTSEGCSSCPPADALLMRLGRGPSENGAEIIPLGFHVDYWNYLGWRDRFSSHAYTARQQEYAASFRDEPYTPQLVVDGESQLVGSDSAGAENAILRAAAQPQTADVQLTWLSPQELQVVARSGDTGSSAQVLLAITENDLSSNVSGGENGGRVLHHSSVVRELRILGHLSQGSFETTVPFKPARDWKLKDVQVVAFVQTAPAGPIQGAAAISLVAASEAASRR